MAACSTKACPQGAQSSQHHAGRQPFLRLHRVVMTQGRGQRIVGVLAELNLNFQKHPDHVGNLLLGGTAASDNGLLDGTRRVLEHVQPGVGSGANGRAARLTELDGGLGSAADEIRVGHGHCGPVCLNQAFDAGKDHAQPLRHGPAAEAQRFSVQKGFTVNDAHAGHARSGVKAENTHHSYASAGISALDHTSWVSSRSSSASKSSRTCPPVSTSTSIRLSARWIIPASSNSSPAAFRPSRTASKSSGAAITSTVPSSAVSMSSAPASRAASITASSSVPGAKTITPLRSNRNATEPSVPRLPPCLLKAKLTS